MVGCPIVAVWAPSDTSCVLMAFALPTGIVKIAPCKPPSASRYRTVSVSIFLRNRLRKRPPPYGAAMLITPTVPPTDLCVSSPVTTS